MRRRSLADVAVSVPTPAPSDWLASTDVCLSCFRFSSCFYRCALHVGILFSVYVEREPVVLKDCCISVKNSNFFGCRHIGYSAGELPSPSNSLPSELPKVQHILGLHCFWSKFLVKLRNAHTVPTLVCLRFIGGHGAVEVKDWAMHMISNTTTALHTVHHSQGWLVGWLELNGTFNTI